jgi:hypothetical protein
MVEIQKKSLRVGKQVDTAHVNEIVRNYKQQRWVQNSQRLGKEDSLSVWYSLEELEEFLTKIKENGGDGVRLYFGVYSENFPDHPLLSGRQTVVFVGTKEKETLSGSTSKDIYINTEKGTSILAHNVGRPCPPFCGTSEDIPGGSGGRGVMTLLDKGNEGMSVA